MSPLLLNSLVVNDFRCFKHLYVSRLGRVNLITGKNNVGKTALLEALWLYSRGGAPFEILELLAMRDEWLDRRRYPATDRPEEQGEQASIIKNLFYCRPSIDQPGDAITIGPTEKATLSIAVNWFKKSDADRIDRLDMMEEWTPQDAAGPDERIPYLVVRNTNHLLDRYPLARLFGGDLGYPRPRDIVPGNFIRFQGLSVADVSLLWDKIALSPREDDVYEALRIVLPDVDRVTLIGDRDRNGWRVPIVKVKGLEEPVPLRSVGAGMSRLFGLALGLVGAKDGMLLNDEVESGLHYSIQPNMWRLIFAVAKRLNVQVFATTHSWDCIQAFQRAAAENEDEGVLIRLQRRGEDVEAVLFDESELAIATREQIEVR